mmetsp:Transcript_137471/g.293794  ORF Transcript_137471/g.293794 Transcript_137471/m.293794 type:complete len:396 (+) Transcript_137471:132-1319(+)
MPPKVVDKKKAQEREKIAVDKTFGMKNKNKSKVVQKYIKSLTNNYAGAPKGGKEEEARKEKAAKEAALQQKALLNGLFNMATDKKGRAFDPVAKKAAKQAEEEAIAAGKKLKAELKKEIIEGVANTIRLTNPKGVRMSELGGHPIISALKDKHVDAWKTISLLLFIKAQDKIFWIDDDESNNPMIRCLEDVEGEVAPDERPIEEILEERRAALPPGGTPVNLETFKAWKAAKEAQRQAQEEEHRQAILKKQAAGKGLVGVSGRDLFTYDATLFVDDDDAASAAELDERSEVDDEEEEPLSRPQGGDDEDEDDNEGADEGADGAEDSGEPDGEQDSLARGSAQASGSFNPPPRGKPSSGEAAAAPAINESLFLEGGDLPDDLDDLDDLEDDEEEEK